MIIVPGRGAIRTIRTEPARGPLRTDLCNTGNVSNRRGERHGVLALTSFATAASSIQNDWWLTAVRPFLLAAG